MCYFIVYVFTVLIHKVENNQKPRKMYWEGVSTLSWTGIPASFLVFIVVYIDNNINTEYKSYERVTDG